jgi:transposase
VRFIGLDVHREFCEVAIAEEGRVRSAGRVRTRRAELELFAQSLGSDDEVALESTGGAVAIARILEAHVARVVVVNTKRLRQISEAKAKTDRLDARRLAELLAAGYLAEVWCPDERTRALRRLVARRAQLVRQRSRAKNEIAAALQRNLLDRPGVYDVAGERGRRFLAGVELPDDERQTVDGCLRQIDFLDEEIAAVNRALAEAAVGSHQMRRLMSVPGVNLQTAATFMACVGDIGRFRDPRKLVSYLGLDPRVRQSGQEPARHGHISKEGASEARHMLCEAAWVVVRHPSPLRAFGEQGAPRCRHRHGRGRPQARGAVLAAAHEGAGLRLRQTQPDPQEAPPARARRRSRARQGRARRLGRHQGAARGGARTRPSGRNRLPPPRQRLAAQKGRGRDSGTRIFKAVKRQAARQGIGPRPCALARRRPRHPKLSQGAPKQSSRNLDSHPSREELARRALAIMEPMEPRR